MDVARHQPGACRVERLHVLRLTPRPRSQFDQVCSRRIVGAGKVEAVVIGWQGKRGAVVEGMKKIGLDLGLETRSRH